MNIVRSQISLGIALPTEQQKNRMHFLGDCQ